MSGNPVVDPATLDKQAVDPSGAANNTPLDSEPSNPFSPLSNEGASAPLIDSTRPTLKIDAVASVLQPTEAALAFAQYKVALQNIVSSDSRSGEIKVFTPILRRALAIFSPPHDAHLGYEKLVAVYVALWSTLEKQETQRYSAQALLGIKALAKGRFGTATAIYKEIEFQTSTPAALTYVMRGVANFVRALVIIMIFVGYPIGALVYYSNISVSSSLVTATIVTLQNVLVAALCGMLGSVISILLRLSEFETTKGRSQMFLILTGATLPLVGGVFGAFVASLLSAKIINIGITGTDPTNVWLFVVLGFLSGFSERFSRGFITLAEDRLGGSGKIQDITKPQAQPGNAIISGTATLSPPLHTQQTIS